MAYKRELIINNGSLTSYKKLLKVSDVCQLLDKLKYSATNTLNGVTFANNGDGTITVNGTATEDNAIFNLVYKVDLLTVIGHKYLLIGCPKGGNASSTYFLRYDSDGDTLAYDMGNGVIFTKTNEKLAYINIRVHAGYTANNLIFKPQLFDLTEMYGAGNEPKTVAEFKAKFPNEMYDYSPRCWVTSYKTGLIAKTKNLLTEIKPFHNTKVENGIAYQDIADRSELNYLKFQLYNGGTFVKQFSGNDQQIGKNTLTFTTDTLPAHTRVVFGLNGVTNDTTVFAPITLENNTTYTLSMDFINITQGEIVWTNSMLEKGSVATDYVPYGYL